MSIKFNKGVHWYDKDGNPKHESDLREARKLLLYPSVTTILKDVLKNQFLENWKTEQVLLAAASTFKQPHETDETYCQRIYDMSNEKSDTAAAFGKELHDAIEGFPQYPLDVKLHPWLDKFAPWYNDSIESTIFAEKVLLDHDIGVAGRCDKICVGRGKFSGQIILPDWKSQGVRKDDKGRKKPNFYPDWVRQLAFYAVSYAKEAGIFPNLPTCISVVIDSTEPDTPFEKVWSKEEVLGAYQEFVVISWLWFNGGAKRKEFWPAANGKWSINTSLPMPC